MLTGRLILWSSASFFFLFPLSAILHRKIKTSLPHEGVELNLCDQQESRGVHSLVDLTCLEFAFKQNQTSPCPGSQQKAWCPPCNPNPGFGCPHYMGEAQDKRSSPHPAMERPMGSGKYIGKAFWEISRLCLSFLSWPFSPLINLKPASETALLWLTESDPNEYLRRFKDNKTALQHLWH